MASRKSKALSEVFNHPPYREEGFVVDIRLSGTIVLSAGKKVDNNFMHSLSKEDSDSILNIIRMSINEEGLL
jgi:hypothetical protein